MSLCWLKDKVTPQECIGVDPEREKELLSNRMLRVKKKCINCPKFFMDLSSISPEPKLEIIKALPDVASDSEALPFDEARRRMESFLFALSSFKDAVDIERVIHSALVILTSGEGFGFNRAIFFTVDGDKLKPVYALGPKSQGEGVSVWRYMEASNVGVRELVNRPEIMKSDTERLKELFPALAIPLSQEHPVGRAFMDKRPAAFYYHHGKDPEVYRIMTALGVTSFGILPVWSEDEPLGMFLVDNVVSMSPVDERRLKVAFDFVNAVAVAVERAKLYHELKGKIEELEEAKSEIEKQQKLILNMEKALSLKEVSSRIIHEIRNPLTIIGGLVARMLKKGEYDIKSLEIILKEVKRIDEILKDIDVYNKSVKPQKVDTDVKYVVKETVRRLRKKYPSLKVELSLPKGKLTAFLDPTHLSKLIENAVINAYEAHVKKGVDEVISLKVAVEGDRLIITVIDRGGGIPEEIRHKVFEPFFTTKEDGTGMGIPVMAVIVKEHGGDLEIENVDGGACVRIALPLK